MSARDRDEPRGPGWLDQERALELHDRLVAGDPVAPSDLAVAFLEVLAAWLIRNAPQIDSHICETAAEDAILALIKNPRSYNPNRQSLDAYLRMSAKGDLRNALRAEARHRKRRADLNVVELSPRPGNYSREGDDPARVIEEMAAEVELGRLLTPPPTPPSVQADLSPEEAKVLELMRSGERRTEVFAEALGVMSLPRAAQRQEVKRAKDRLKRRIERARKRNE